MADESRLHDRTTARIDGMSDEERAELHRDLSGRKPTVPDEGLRRVATPNYGVLRTAEEEAEVAAKVARLQADLHRTNRRLHQIERSTTSSRYQLGEGPPPSGRHARLLSRAKRLERQLRALR